VSVDLGGLLDALTDLIGSGKRLRPAFCYWAWRGAGGPDGEEIVRAAASFELLHACAIVHDDVMDGSDTRRGSPAAHRRFAALHRGQSWQGDADTFGVGAAILLGDICLAWADEMLTGCGLPTDALMRARSAYDVMRTELMGGQYLDLLEQAQGGASTERAMRVLRFKSAKYTVERPLHVGALLADAGEGMLAAYSAYGVPLGEAFQLRDDVLGVFGDPQQTGKPAGDDLREGKRTMLVTTALERATSEQADVVRRHLGDPLLDDEGVATLRALIEETGALAETERLIESLTERALAGLAAAELEPDARAVLRDLAAAATARRV
jgi:geranylgeranyl diphosphate synthase, type I